MNPFTIGPALIGRALDDLSAIADAARGLASLEAAVLAAVGRIESRLDTLNVEIRGLGTMPAQFAALHTQIVGLREDMAGLRDEVRPIKDIAAVRAGIEPLDDDMRAVRHSVGDLEPLLREVNQRLEGLDTRIETLRGDLSPLGELADKIPGVGRR
jgi:chaperonin cofactor prefoldin